MTASIAVRHPFPLSNSLRPISIGFDTIFDRLIDFADSTGREPSKYPPYNIEEISQNNYAIEVALAGISKGDVEIELNDGILTIVKDTDNEEDAETRKFLHRGISQRNFVLSFKLAPYIRINSAKMNDGILRLDLEQVLPEERKPKKISISE